MGQADRAGYKVVSKETWVGIKEQPERPEQAERPEARERPEQPERPEMAHRLGVR